MFNLHNTVDQLAVNSSVNRTVQDKTRQNSNEKSRRVALIAIKESENLKLSGIPFFEMIITLAHYYSLAFKHEELAQ